MPITPLPTPPNRGMDPDDFVTAADTFLSALPLFATQVQAEVNNINAPTMSDYVRESVIVAVDAAALRLAAGVVIGTHVQAYNAKLAAIAGVTGAADKLFYFTGASAGAVTDLTSVARTLLAQTSLASMRTTGLGLGSAATQSTGTSGANLGLLNANLTFSGTNTFSGALIFSNTVTKGSAGHFLHHASSSHASGSVTVSTDDPSGGDDGDIWLKVAE